jgi:ABC-type dipeptide/oligopeptide/nickel transport system ATPase component
MRVDYPQRPQTLQAVSFDVRRGEALGLIGESGSGKSTIALAILRLLGMKNGKVTGSIAFRGRELTTLPEREMRSIRGREIGLVLQSPLSSLNPALRIGTQLAEAWKAHANGTRSELLAAVQRALVAVGLPHDEEFRSRYPSQMSVGQAQRVLIAIAVMHSPALLIADEPTSALDAVTQWEILKLFTRLNRTLGSAVLYISHDLASVASICQRVAILHDGEIVESGTTEAVLTSPAHEYTKQLLACAPWSMGWSLPRKGASPVPFDKPVVVANSRWRMSRNRVQIPKPVVLPARNLPPS